MKKKIKYSTTEMPDDVKLFTDENLTVAYKIYNKKDNQDTIVLFYGFAGSINMMDVFAPHFQKCNVLVIDYPGHGYSPILSDNKLYCVKAFTKTVSNLLDHLNEKEIFLIGYSFGGITALQFYMDNKERVKKITFLHASANFRHNYYKKIFYKVFEILISLNFKIFVPHFAIPSLMDKYFTKELLKTSQKVVLYNDFESVISNFKITIKKNYNFALTEISCPALIIGSKKDMLVEQSDSKRIAAKIKNSKLLIFEDKGHIAIASCPEEISNVITNFFIEQKIDT